MSRLYIVSTPIGNLADTTHRAVAVLGSVNRILAEDTRRTAILLKHYGIATPLVSAHGHNEAARAEQIVAWLDAGEELALVSDAGTPLLSDPGARIVQRVLAAGHEVVPVPGASAILAALVASGLDPEPFTFYGFLPRSGRSRQERVEEIAALPHVAVLYEAPTRLRKTLQDLRARCGPDRRAVVARELTKVYETFVRGTLSELAGYYAQEPVRGEVVLLVAGAEPAREDEQAREASARALARSLLQAGRAPREVARELARTLKLARNRAYEIVLSTQREDGGEED